MGARHVINTNQLTLFERAGDLADPEQFYPNDAVVEHAAYYGDELSNPARERAGIRRNKLDESISSGLYKSIREQGVQEPVQLIYKNDAGYSDDAQRLGGIRPKRGHLMNGHHRVYSQAEIDPEAYVPVSWGYD